MRRGTGRTITLVVATVIGGTLLARKSGINIPGFSS